MSRKRRPTRNADERAARRNPAPGAGDRLAAQIARGLASGAARSVTDWIIEQIKDLDA